MSGGVAGEERQLSPLCRFLGARSRRGIARRQGPVCFHRLLVRCALQGAIECHTKMDREAGAAPEGRLKVAQDEILGYFPKQESSPVGTAETNRPAVQG
jgi:hypothetical protein